MRCCPHPWTTSMLSGGSRNQRPQNQGSLHAHTIAFPSQHNKQRNYINNLRFSLFYQEGESIVQVLED